MTVEIHRAKNYMVFWTIRNIGVGNVCQIYFDAALPNDIQLINNYTVNGFTIEVLVSTDRTYIDLATTGQDLGKVLLVQGETYELITGTNLPNVTNVIINLDNGSGGAVSYNSTQYDVAILNKYANYIHQSYDR